MSKSSIRSAVLQQRNNLSAMECCELSARVQQQLMALPEFSAAKVLALYSPLGCEVQTDRLFIGARVQGKTVVYPRMTSSGLEFVVVTNRQDMVVGRFGILEPAAGIVVSPEQICLLVVPGVAFTVGGDRLGYGQGWYDRTLAARGTKTILMGICFELQIVTALPVEQHDVPMDLVVTEERLIRVSTGVV